MSYTLKLDLTEYQRAVLGGLLDAELTRGEKAHYTGTPRHGAIMAIKDQVDGYAAAARTAKEIAMMTDDEARFARIRELDEQFQHLIGREAYGHASQPTPGTWRIAFATGVVCLSPEEAESYMVGLLAVARQDPKQLPYPLDQELTPEQDLRVINGWVD